MIQSVPPPHTYLTSRFSSKLFKTGNTFRSARWTPSNIKTDPESAARTAAWSTHFNWFPWNSLRCFKSPSAVVCSWMKRYSNFWWFWGRWLDGSRDNACRTNWRLYRPAAGELNRNTSWFYSIQRNLGKVLFLNENNLELNWPIEICVESTGDTCCSLWQRIEVPIKSFEPFQIGIYWMDKEKNARWKWNPCWNEHVRACRYKRRRHSFTRVWAPNSTRKWE